MTISKAAVHASDRSGLQSYDVGFRVEVPTSWLSANNIEAEEWINPNYLEYQIPRELFGEFNQFPRFPWTPRK